MSDIDNSAGLPWFSLGVENLFSSLPKPAQERYTAIADKREENTVLNHLASDRRMEAHSALMAAKARLQKIEADYPQYDPEEERQAIVKAQAEYDRCDEAYNARVAASSGVLRTHSALEQYLKTLSNRFGVHAGDISSKIALAKAPADSGLTAAAAARVVDELRADLHEVQSAPIPSKVAKAIAKRKVDALAEAGRPNLHGTIEGGTPPIWDNVSYAALAGRDFNGENVATPALAIAAWLDPGKMLKALEAEIDALADDDNALDDATRAKKITELNSKILEAQRAEVAAIDRERGDFSYRDGTDPQAILGIAVTGGRESDR